MTEQIFFGAALIFLATIGLSVHRIGPGAGGRDWALAWLALYGAGSLAVAEQRIPALGVLYPPLVTLFSALLFTGAREYAGRPVPSWLIPAALALGLLRGAAEPFAPSALTHAPGAAIMTAGAVAASLTLIGRGGLGAWDRILAGGMLAIPVAAWVFAYWRIAETPSPPAFTLWLLVGVFVGFSQICALLSRLVRRSSRQHATLAALVESVPIGLSLSGPDGTVRTMNSEFARQLGFADADQQIGRPFTEMADRLRSLVEPEVARQMDRGRSRLGSSTDSFGEIEFRFLDGRVALGASRIVRSQQGESLGQLWYLKDITEERRLDAELQGARQLEVLGGLAGGVAHDFNNKLTAVLGNASFLSDTLDEDDPNREVLADLEAAAEYCAELTRDLLTLARQGPRSPISVEPLTFLRRLGDDLQRDLPLDVRLEVTVAPDCPPIEADSVQLERTITNLVVNARDSIEGAGQIRISATPSGAGPEQWVELAVRDDGVGMDADTRERIFDPFYTTKDVGEGTGLGLAIVLGIVAAHGGEVSVESAPGRGTRITTTWPVAGRNAGSGDGARSNEKVVGSECILVVEDEAAIRRFIHTTLDRAGFRVLDAASGATGLEIYEERHHEVELVLVDLAMPGVSGVEVARAVRQKHPELPILLMSGNLDLAAESLEALGVGTLAKPFRSTSLLRAIRSAIDGPSGVH
jgi:PAS domain S-box-containing protein